MFFSINPLKNLTHFVPWFSNRLYTESRQGKESNPVVKTNPVITWYLPQHLPRSIPSIFSFYPLHLNPTVPINPHQIQRIISLLPSLQIPPPFSHPSLHLRLVQPNSDLKRREIPDSISRKLDRFREMEFLEMPYEPVSFRLYSLAASSAGGSLLTCLAVLAAAAVGFWRMRTTGSRSDSASSLFTSSPSEGTPKKAVPEPVQVQEEAVVRSKESDAVSPSSSERYDEGVNTPKIRFMAYFESEDSIGCCHVDDEEEEQTEDDGSCEESDYQEVSLPQEKEEEEVKYWPEGMVVRKRDLGWYSYQDMAVLNGSVVRLWDGESSPRRRKGTLAISSF